MKPSPEVITCFLDFDKEQEIFSLNLYFREEKLVAKLPFVKNQEPYEQGYDKIEIHPFNLAKFTYLTTCI